jgi:hypothetical protein
VERSSQVQIQLLHLQSHNLVLLFALLLRIDYFFLFDPLAPGLFLVALPFLLLHRHQSPRLEVVFLRSQHFGLDDCLGLSLRFGLETFLTDGAFEHSLHDPVFGNVPESMVNDLALNDSSFFLRVVVGA